VKIEISIPYHFVLLCGVSTTSADPSGHTTQGMGLQLLACCNFGFKSR